ncbi:HAMP domain-containing protein [Paenibacillus athensensis]|nr:adenylate/guanylate cyclase domain-containing protein [Paenibacillus athensensis]MCD1260509.1 HAMP domain-containing protein [Paenibacillus athensensis]
MKRSIAALLLTVLLLGAAGAYIYNHKTLLQESPLQREELFGSLSKAVVGADHHLYVVVNSRKTIYKLNEEGTIVQSISNERDPSGLAYRFNDMAVDDEGYLYAIRASLDAYGLTVKSEEIVRFKPNGEFDGMLFQQNYVNATPRFYRFGSLRNVEIHDDTLYFYNNEVSQFTMYKVPKDADKAEAVFTVPLPTGKYFTTADGITPEHIYYSTRSGEIYRAKTDGSSEMVYPLPGLDRTRRNFPESLRMDQQGRLVFVDFNNRAITRFDPQNPFMVEALVTDKTAQASGIELSFETTSSSVAPDGSILIVEDGQIVRRQPDGKLSEPLLAARYSKEYITTKWLVWAAVAASALLLLYALKLIYFNLMRRRLSMMAKQVLIYVPIICAAMILLSTVIYTSFARKMEDETDSELVLLAKSGQNLIDGDKLESLTSPLDYRGPVFRSFRQKIKAVFDNNTRDDNQGFYKAVYKYENGQIYRIMEDDDEMHMFNPFPATDKNQLVVKEGKVETDKWEDDSGVWRYAIAPIYNSSGKIVGIFETSKNMEGLLQHRRTVLKSIEHNIAYMSAGLLLVLMLTTFLQLRPIRKLRNSVGEIAKGNWDTKVEINTRDEVNDLGDSVNVMAAHIRDYITKVENFSQSYYRFVPQQFLRFLEKESILEVELGDQVEENMSVMMFNIRNFFTLSKSLTPEENFNFVNSYLSRFGPFVRGRQGMVNKYLGSGFMALFPDKADEALTACIEIRKELEIYNMHRGNMRYAPVELGLALHKGPLRLGIIGEGQRLEGNVISDGVNLTSVLEKLTDPLGASILITDSVVGALGDASRFQYRSLGLVQLDGFKEPLQLYDVYQGDPDTFRVLKEKTKALFEQAVTYYQVGRFYDAREAFLMVIKQNRLDKAAQLYFYLCDEFYQHGTTEGWNGTLSVS